MLHIIGLAVVAETEAKDGAAERGYKRLRRWGRGPGKLRLSAPSSMQQSYMYVLTVGKIKLGEHYSLAGAA